MLVSSLYWTWVRLKVKLYQMLLYVKPESFRPSASASFGQQVRPVHSCEHQIG